MRELVQEEEVKGFDTKVTHRDPRTGQIVRRDPYIKRVCSKEGGGVARYFERPAGSGNLWDKQGNPVGRWDGSKPEGERYLKNAAHIAWERPKTEDEKLAAELISREQENAALKAELAAMKAEQAKSAGKPQDKRER